MGWSAARTAAGAVHGFPAALTSFVGRAILWRIHVEEGALLTTLGDRYRCYASQHKRLVPLVW